jgi:hypothetical protein
MNNSIYYWGEPDTTISFCEKKYAQSFWIAEYTNTMSALPYIIFGCFFLITKIKNIGMTMICLGVSTMIMHSTLRYYGQWLDECSMLIISYSALQLIHKNLSNNGHYAIIIYYLFIKDYFILFFLTFFCMQLYIIYKTYQKKLSKLQLIFIKLYIFCFSLGLFCWFVDQLLCKNINDIPFHAAWHILTAFGMFYGFVSFLII